MKKSISPRSLNTDDNKLTLGPQESTFSLNIDAEGFGEDESGVVKHVRGNLATSRSDEGVILPFGDNKILGSISDDQLNVVYFFVYNSEGQHSVVAYSSTTNTYRTVFVSSALEFTEDSFVKADIVRLRRTPEDQELIVEPPVPPAQFNPVELRFFVGIDFSVWGEKNGYKSSDPAPQVINSTQVIFTPQNGLRLYDGPGIITDDTPTIGNFQDEFKAGLNEFDGWVKYGVFVLHVHPEDIQNASKFLKYKIANNLGGPEPTAGDVFRTISNSTMVQASTVGANGLQLGRPCYGFNKSIEEILVDDIFAGGFNPLKSLMNSSTSSGLLLDRKLNFKASCNYSETPEWGSALIAAVNDYEGGPFTSGSQGERSHPAERMDNGGEGPGVGPGGGGGGELELVTITYCTNENWQTIGAAYPSVSEAVAAAFTYDPQEYIVTIENLCPVSGTSTTLEPTMWIYDSRSTEYESFPSENAVVFDVDLETIPSNYSFTGKFNLSSCGTMRTQSGFIFGGPGGASTTEIPPTFVPAPLGLYWAPQSGQGTNGYEFGDRISQIGTLDAPNIDLDGGELQQDTRFRQFEVSVNPGEGQVNIFTGGQALDVAGIVWYESAAGSGQPTSSTNLCYGTHSACGITGSAPPPPRDFTDTGDVVVEGTEAPASTGGDTPSPDTTTDTTTTTTTTTTTRDVTQRDSTLTRDIPEDLNDTSISKEKTKTAKGK